MNPHGVHFLKWERHLDNLNDLFQRMYDENCMVDVTLACKEGSIKAHKLVLTACSPFFERVLLENPCKHPVLIMRGVTLNDMQKLTSFMYKGSIEVLPNDLSNFLKIGEDLEIRGIKEIKHCGKKRKVDSTRDILNIKPENYSNRRDTRYKGKKRVAVDHSPLREISSSPDISMLKSSIDDSSQRPKNFINKFLTEECLNDKFLTADMEGQIKKEKLSYTDTDVEDVEDVATEDTNSSKTDSPKSLLDKSPSQPDPNNLFVMEKTLLPCSICCKPFETDESLQQHMVHVHTKKFQCDMCTISFNRSSHLERHRRTHTGERPFQCNLCDRDFSRQDKLRQHLRTSHCDTHNELSTTDSQWEVGMETTMESIGTDGKRRRGRPRKYPPKVVQPFAEKRKRGRPRKVDTENGQSLQTGALRCPENYDITSLPYGDFNYLMMPPHDTEFSIVEPVVEIVSEQTDNNESTVDNGPTSSQALALNNVNDSSVDSSSEAMDKGNNFVESIHKIGECTIRAVSPPPSPCSLIV